MSKNEVSMMITLMKQFEFFGSQVFVYFPHICLYSLWEDLFISSWMNEVLVIIFAFNSFLPIQNIYH